MRQNCREGWDLAGGSWHSIPQREEDMEVMPQIYFFLAFFWAMPVAAGAAVELSTMVIPGVHLKSGEESGLE